MPKFVESIELSKAEIFEKQRFGLIAMMFGKALWVAKLKGAKRHLCLDYLGEKDGMLHFDLTEDNSTYLISEDLRCVGTALNDDGIPMLNEDGTPIPPPKGEGDWNSRRPIGEDPKEWYGDAYPSLKEAEAAHKAISVDEKIAASMVGQFEVVSADGSKKIVTARPLPAA